MLKVRNYFGWPSRKELTAEKTSIPTTAHSCISKPSPTGWKLRHDSWIWWYIFICERDLEDGRTGVHELNLGHVAGAGKFVVACEGICEWRDLEHQGFALISPILKFTSV